MACIVDLSRPLVLMFTLDGEEFKVEYENLNDLCIFCGMYDHLDAICTKKPIAASDANMNEGSTAAVKDSKSICGS